MPPFSREIRIITRSSRLALSQAEFVRHLLLQIEPQLKVILIPIKTSGDLFLDRPLKEVGGKGLFVKEIEEALLENRADLAVHSLKDVPAAVARGLQLSAFVRQEDPRDVLVFPAKDKATHSKKYALKSLPLKARIATSSARRSALLRHFRPDLQIVPIRGNVDTRLRKLDQGDLNVDALMLAAAGLKRLGLVERVGAYLETGDFIPAAGQGILGIETRKGDGDLNRFLGGIDDDETRSRAICERAFIEWLGADCSVPIGGYAQVSGKKIVFTAFVASEDGKELISASESGRMGDEKKLGTSLAKKLLARGGKKLLAELRQSSISSKTSLEGKIILITRPEKDIAEFRSALVAKGAQVLAYPAIEMCPIKDKKILLRLEKALHELADYRWLVFTSANGVQIFFQKLKKAGLEKSFKNTKQKPRIAVIGKKTKSAVESFGYRVDLCPAVFQGEALAQVLIDEDAVAFKKGARLLIPRAKQAREVLPELLVEAGARAEVIPIYETRPSNAPITAIRRQLENRKIDGITFTSSSTVEMFLDKLPPRKRQSLLQGVALACIGPITAMTLRERGFEPTLVSETFTTEGLTQALEQYFNK